MSVKAPLPIFARLGEREMPVGWAWFRPEPRVGDTVRLRTSASGDDGWQSFRVVGKWLREETSAGELTDGDGAPAGGTIHLDVEPLAS